MANGAGRIFEVMKNTSEETNIKPSLVVSLTVKSINPLILTRDDRLEITEDFCIFSKYIDKTAIEIGDILTAFLFNDGQVYYIEENTNKYPINTVVVSSTQPDTNAQVWFKFGKNKFNKDDVLMSIGLNSFTGETMFVPELATTDFIEVCPNTFYTVNWEVTDICYYTENKTFISSNVSDKTFFTPSNCKYIRATVYIDALNSQLQLEPGIKSTTYESYTEKEILVKSNDVFEIFLKVNNLLNNEYSTEERRIGTWIDGKPLYRKVIQTTTPTVTTNGTSVWQQVVMQNVKFGRVTDCQMLSNLANGTLLSPITRSTLSSGLNQFITVSFVNKTSNNTGVFQIESSSTTYNNRTVYAVIEYTKTTD